MFEKLAVFLYSYRTSTFSDMANFQPWMCLLSAKHDKAGRNRGSVHVESLLWSQVGFERPEKRRFDLIENSYEMERTTVK